MNEETPTKNKRKSLRDAVSSALFPQIEVPVAAATPPTTAPGTKRCPKGTRKNRKTGLCEPVVDRQPSVPVMPQVEVPIPSTPAPPATAVPGTKRCPKGTRRNRKTGNCDPIVAPPQPAVKTPIVDEKPDDGTSVGFRRNVDKLPEVVLRSLESQPMPAPQPVVQRPVPPPPAPEPVPQTPIESPAPEEPAAPPEPEEELSPELRNQAIQELHEEYVHETAKQLGLSEPTPLKMPKVEYPIESIESPTATAPKAPKEPPSPAPSAPPTAPTPISTELVPPLIDQEGNQEPVYREPPTDPGAPTTIPTQALYPTLDDPDFNRKIAQRKEFQDTRYTAPIGSIEEEQNARCTADFEIFPHQSFIKNFLSMQTPYNSVLVYAGLGTGKTCTAIGIAEEMRAYIKQVGLQKRVLIMAQPNVLDNFRLQLFDESRLKFQDGEWNIQSCVGKSILDEINPTELKTMNRTRIVQNVQAILRTYYDFKGYIKFANDLAEALRAFPANDVARRARKIQAMFDNTLIIVDEVHNIRMTSDNESNMTTANYLFMIAKYARNVRFVLLSATPMYNSYKEIVWLTNLMNLNDKRGEISADQVFTKDGDFKPEGRALLKRKLTGYVSYVRGENPYSFPFRIYRENLEEAGLQVDPPTYPPIYITKMDEFQAESYNKILTEIRAILTARARASAPGSPMATPETEAEEADLGAALETLDNVGYEQLQLPIQALNITYGDGLVGSQGLRTIMQDQQNGQFDYMENVEHVFQPDQIAKYSRKIATILEKIQTAEGGITIIYSEFLDAGVIPMAMALEEAGFSRFPGTRVGEQNRNVLLKTKATTKRYAMITGSNLYSPNNKDELKTITADTNKNGEQIQVVLITRAGAEGIDFKNIRQIHIMEPWYNMSRIEQIIGRGVRNGSHCGLPFAQRNVEIYMHATQTTDGRPSADMYLYEFAFKKAKKIGQVSRVLKQTAVDCILNKEQQNFTPELLGQVPENRQIELQTAHGPHTIQPGDQPYTAVCDYAETCQTGCDPDEDPDQADVAAIRQTYGLEYLTTNHIKILQHIRTMFQKQSFYPIDDLVRAIQGQSKTVNYTMEQIFYCLTYLMENRNREFLYDKAGRRGFLINRGEIYAFQPVEITDEASSIFDRTFPILFRPSRVVLEVSPKFREEPTGLLGRAEGAVATPMASAASAPPSIRRKTPKIAKGIIEEEEGDEDQDATVPVATAPAPETKTRYEILVDQIEYDLAHMDEIRLNREARAAIPAAKHTDYTFAGILYESLQTEHGMTPEQIRDYMIDHAIDALSLYDKLVLAAGGEAPAPGRIRDYFQERMYQDGKYLLLTNEQNNIVVYVRAGGEAATTKSWTLGKPTDELAVKRQVLDPMKQRLTPYQSKIPPLTAFFVADDPKNQNTGFVLKVKDFTKETRSKNAKGENLKKAGKKRTLEILDMLRGHLDIAETDETTLNQGTLCVLIELLMRHARDEDRGFYYLRPEEYAVIGF